LNVFFDVDDTIVSSWDGSLRPLVKEVFAQLNLDGHDLYIWSGVGLRWYEIDKHGLRPYIKGCFVKPLWDHRRRLPLLGIEVEPHFVIDDYQEVVDVFGGHTIKPYFRRDPGDKEMAVVYEKIRTYDPDGRRPA